MMYVYSNQYYIYVLDFKRTFFKYFKILLYSNCIETPFHKSLIFFWELY